MGMKVKLWGVRGSLPTPRHPAVQSEHLQKLMYDFFDSGFNKKTEIEAYINSQPRYKVGGFGGNTLCVEVTTNKTKIIIDGGSGLKSLGAELLSTEFGKGQGELHLLMTHFHWDHLIGIPFFAPIFIPGNKINIYSVQDTAEALYERFFKNPTFQYLTKHSVQLLFFIN